MKKSYEPVLKQGPRKPARRKPLRHRSEKRQALRDDELAMAEVVYRRDGGCVLRQQASHVCTGKRETPHHLAKSSAGGLWSLGNLVCLCAGGNGLVEDDPPWGRNVGLVVRWDITPAEAWDRRVACGLVVRTVRPDDDTAPSTD